MAKTTDEIYDLLHAVDKKVDTHIAVVVYRLNALEAKNAEKGVKRWHFWSAISASPLAGAVLGYLGFKAGA